MKVSLNWLCECIGQNLPVDEVSNILTNCGLEVEEVQKYESIKGGLKGIVVGKILDIQKHPSADKLKVTKVKIGNEEILQIICGAPNIMVGQKVLVATIGTTLYKNDEPYEIKKVNIRGVDSYGMICSEAELGIGEDASGIAVLPETTIEGTPAKEYFDIYEDYVLTIGLTPNRGDAASHYGVARDLVAVINSKENKKLKLKELPIASLSSEINELPVAVKILDTTACKRYCGVVMKNVKIAPSPEWLKNRLKAVGIRPINNVVDITNYILMYVGQPLHAFDFSKIEGNEVIIKKFDSKILFKTLDEVEREITPEDLMICNANKAMCIAGIFGGVESGVTENTTEIFLESAYFDPLTIRRTSNRLGLKTESSFRFERGVDISNTKTALLMAVKLIEEICSATVASPVYDVFPVQVEKQKINISYEYIKKILGCELSKNKIINILDDLSFEIVKETNENLEILVPLNKTDVYRPIDIVEEIARIYGFNNIDLPDSIKIGQNNINRKNLIKIQNAIADYLSSNSFFEIMTNSLTGSRYYENSSDVVQIMNPLSNELNVLRKTLLYSGLESIMHNINRKQYDLKLYEFGTVYKQKSNNRNLSVTERFSEEKHLSIFLTGNKSKITWREKSENVDFYNLKHFVETIFEKMFLDEYDYSLSKNNVFSYGLTYYTKNGVIIAEVGKVSSKILKLFDCKQDVFFAEINWSFLLENYLQKDFVIEEVSKYPEVYRDISMFVDSKIWYKEIKKVVEQISDKILSVSLFDVYEGDKIPEGKKSYAIRIILQDKEKTLTDEEIDAIIEKIKNNLILKLNAQIR